jgi:hypothetical protein
MNTIYQGEDIKLEFTLTDDQYNPINIATVNQIIVYVWENTTGTPKVWFKYAKEAISGYKSIIAGYDDINGRFKILLESADTIQLPEGDLMAEIKVAFPDDEFTDNDLKTVAADIIIGTVSTSQTKDE